MREQPPDALIEGAYWVSPGRLAAGPYPGEYELAQARSNFMRLLRAGIRCFVSLMEAREEALTDGAEARYVPILVESAQRLGVTIRFERFAIHDMSVPEPPLLKAALDFVQASLDCGEPTYIHCWGGRGRTGTLVGAWLIGQGLADQDNFVKVIRELRSGFTGRSPETDEQVAFVREHSLGFRSNSVNR